MNERRLFLILFAIVYFLGTNAQTYAAPYESYNYSYWEEAVPSATAYVPSKIIRGVDLGLEDFSEPTDICISKDKIYILDSGKNSFVVLDNEWNLLDYITNFKNGKDKDTFNSPQGIYVTKKGNIYIADTGNKRIVKLDDNYNLVSVFKKPDTQLLKDVEFSPVKISLDKSGRIYVIVKGIYEGIIELDSGGGFSRFTGVNKVVFNPMDYFWKRIATKKQKEQMKLYVPTEFKNLDIDNSGFIYTVSTGKNSEEPIKKINPKGDDVLRKQGYHDPIGDIQYPLIGMETGPSNFTAITVNEYGMYSALDSKRGRIFTYDDEGNLLYVFGGIGNQEGTFKNPTALEYLNDEIVVVDSIAKNITVFSPTKFGRAINEATKFHYNGKYEKAAEYWQKALNYDTNYELAYVGIGKSLLRQHKYKEAADFFKLGNNKIYYSKAYEKYRKQVLRKHFSTIMTTILLIVAFLIIRSLYKKKRRGEQL